MCSFWNDLVLSNIGKVHQVKLNAKKTHVSSAHILSTVMYRSLPMLVTIPRVKQVREMRQKLNNAAIALC